MDLMHLMPLVLLEQQRESNSLVMVPSQEGQSPAIGQLVGRMPMPSQAASGTSQSTFTSTSAPHHPTLHL